MNQPVSEGEVGGVRLTEELNQNQPKTKKPQNKQKNPQKHNTEFIVLYLLQYVLHY